MLDYIAGTTHTATYLSSHTVTVTPYLTVSRQMNSGVWGPMWNSDSVVNSLILCHTNKTQKSNFGGIPGRFGA